MERLLRGTPGARPDRMLHYQPRGGTGTRGSTTCFASGSSGSEAVRRGLGGLFLVGVALAQSGPSLQKEREAQQEAYQNWRQTDPNLERDASTAGATLGARADKAAAAAAKYFSARKTYLASLETEARQKASAVKAVSLAPNVTPNLEAHLNGRSTILGASIETIAHDSDRGIQQLR